MRHHVKKRKLGREKNQRNALVKSLTRSLFLKGRITTTEARAKEIRPVVEKMITRAKEPTLASRRQLAAQLGGPMLVKKIELVAQAHKERRGGYTRIIKTGPRKGDASPMAIIEFVGANA